MLSTVLSVFLFGCETWYRTFREEHKPRIFEKRMLRKIFGPRGSNRRKLRNEELCGLNCHEILRAVKRDEMVG